MINLENKQFTTVLFGRR